MNAEDRRQALALRIARLNNETALLNANGSDNYTVIEGGYGATAHLLYEGPITITHISEEQTSEPREGFEDLASEYVTITFKTALKKSPKPYKRNIFKNKAPLFYEELEEAALTADPDTRAIEEFDWDGDVRVFDPHTKKPFLIERKDSDGKVKSTSQSTHMGPIILLPGESLQTELRREIRRREFVGQNIPIGDEADEANEGGNTGK